MFASNPIRTPVGNASPIRTVSRCLVCGFGEVRTDEVVDRGILLLTECPRCEHRTTRRLEHAEVTVDLAARVRRPEPEVDQAA